MTSRVLFLALAGFGVACLPLAAQEEAGERRRPELAADLDALINVATIWTTSSDGLEMLYSPKLEDPKQQKKPPQFEWMNAEKSRARFSRHMFSNVETKLTMFGGSIKVEEAVLEYVNGKAAKTTISFYNRGDSGDIEVKDFDRIFKTIGQNLGQVLKGADNCDATCPAPGMEDNGSGSALVLELARVLPRYTFKRTLVFMLTTAEEHGLIGAEAMAQWCEDNNIRIKGVQNNDIVGGVLCGETSSPPSCEIPGSIDSMEVRLFSNGSVAQVHRGFARAMELWYEEKLQSQVAVPMNITVQNQEDRDGRGGDHIPFRQHGFRSLRFTSRNENGNAEVDDPSYSDHQHTSDDILGIGKNTHERKNYCSL